MPEIQRAILLPPPSHLPQRASARAVQIDSDSLLEASRSTRRQSPIVAQPYLALVESRREDTLELRGKQFRFRPYSRSGAEIDPRAANPSAQQNEVQAGGSTEIAGNTSLEVFDGLGAGAHARNSSAFIASFIAQERLRQGLHNPQFEAASDAYRRAGGSPAVFDTQPLVVSFAV